MAKHSKRLIALILSIVMVLGLAIPAGAATNSDLVKLPYSESTITPDPRLPQLEKDEDAAEVETPADDEIFRVSIILEDDSTLDKGYSTNDIANNKSAMKYRDSLEAKQEKVEATIEKEVLGGEDLDTVWNLTLAANLISANVEYGQIEEIKAIKGVKDVVIEAQYAPAVTDDDLPVDPQMSTSSVQIGSGIAWADGYTGAGSTVAIIDTGIDDDHKSFDADAFDYAIAKVIESGKEVDLMEVSDIEEVFDQLNIVKLGDYTGDAAGLYLNSKVPFAFNYVDGDLDINHDKDSQGEHGSHVTGIAAANRYIKDGDGYVEALSSVMTQGVAPDAQIITMKVFGKGGGAYDSDYMAAIEDAIILGADTVNLSLGSSMAGFSRSDAYEYILNKLVESDTVVTISAGNSGYWSEESYMPYLYGDDVNFDTVGSPGSFTNSLAVASVDNVGATGDYVSVGGNMIVYTETSGYGNKALSSIAGDYEYVIIDGIGEKEDFAAISDILDGKIALCYRGTISFYEKANNAVKYGAAATIVVNNQPGTISMDLTGYTKTNPCVSITFADGELFWDNADYEGEQDGVWYATGSMTVGDTVASSGAEKNEDGIYNMSSFSSWGVPGSLTMKPEITAPGGNIYSVNGAIAGGQAYENMSGTSMAAPQVSGMAAVVAQYIRENADRFADVELTTRGLINSLLMATAEPIIEEASGNYYSILAQGAGLANVGNAVNADAYILMGDDATASAADGKVKVELGDDPDKEGVYNYSFTINNTSGTENVYTLDTTLFTQDLFTDVNLAYGVEGITNEYLQLDTWTTPISADVTYTVDGAPFDTEARIDADVNKDGYTNADDAQAILDYLVGNVAAEELNLAVGDLDGDGEITTYDAHLLLLGIEALLTVPANGSVEVEVTATITEDLSAYVNGAYIEGYTFVNPVASEEGVLDVVYSIPVLGFYGNWSDASMFDRVSVADYYYGSEFYESAYDYYFSYTGEFTDELDYRDGDDRSTYMLFGNPYAWDEEYHPEREALRSKDTLTAYYYSLIRNAGARLAVIYDSKGNPVYSTSISSEYAAFYYDSAAAWYYTSSGVNLNVKVADLNTKNDEQFTFEMYAIPEYYLTDEMYEDGVITLDEVLSITDQLGDGAVVSKTITVDDEAPEFVGSAWKSTDSGDLKITVKDNQYIAYAIALNRSGTMMFAEVTADELDQTKPGQEYDLVFSGEDLADAGEWVAIAVYDYAGNMSVTEVQYGEHVNRIGKMYGFTSSLFGNSSGALNTWLGLDPKTVNITATADEGYALEDITTFPVVAAEYIDGYVFQADAEGNLYVAPESDFSLTTLIGNMGIVPVDMAYDYETGALYALVTVGTNSNANRNAVYKINPLTARTSLAFNADAKTTNMTGAENHVQLSGMAIDDEGTFYFDGGSLFTVSNWDRSAVDPTVTTIGTTPMFGSNLPTTNSTLAWDHNENILYMVSKSTVGNTNNFLAIIDTTAGTYKRANGSTSGSQLYAPFTALFVAPGLVAGEDFDPTETVDGITVTPEETSIMVGESFQLSAHLTPWTLSDTSVTWTSSDEAIATVDANGIVTGVDKGTATITAASNLDPDKKATCEVTVEKIEVTATGVLADDNGNPKFFTWNLGTGTLEMGEDLAMYPTNATNVDDETFYMINDSGSMYLMDKETGKYISGGSDWSDIWGVAYSNSYGAAFYAYGPYLLGPDDPSDDASWYGWNFEDYLYGAYLIAIDAVDEAWSMNLSGTRYSGNTILYAMDTDNWVWEFYVYEDSTYGTSVLFGSYPSDLDASIVGYDNLPYSNLVAGDDGALYYSMMTGDTNELYRLEYDYDEDMYVSTRLGDVGYDVWPALLLEVTVNDDSADNSADAGNSRNINKNLTLATEKAQALDLSEIKVATDDTDEQIPVTGGLNAVSLTTGETAGKEKQNVIVDTEANTVTVKVYADDSTNALLSVNYDADIFTLESVDGFTQYNAYNADTAGKVAFDFASAGALTQKVAEVVLSYDEEDEKNINTEIIVTVEEESENVDLNETEIIPIDLTEDVEEPETPSTPVTPDPETPEAPDAPETPDTADKNGNPNSPITGAEAGLLTAFMLFLLIGCGVLSVFPAKRRRKGTQE